MRWAALKAAWKVRQLADRTAAGSADRTADHSAARSVAWLELSRVDSKAEKLAAKSVVQMVRKMVVQRAQKMVEQLDTVKAGMLAAQ